MCVMKRPKPLDTAPRRRVHRDQHPAHVSNPIFTALIGEARFFVCDSASQMHANREDNAMPMIDIYAVAGTFADPKQLAIDAATTVKTIEGVPDIPMFRQNTAAFVHELPAGTLANVDGDETYVRVQVLTNEGALDRTKQLAVVEQLTKLVSTAAGDERLQERTWVLLTEAKEGGWGLWGHAHTNEELVAAARAEIAKLRSASS
jgi:phenylpyruvate tautomerase PptA (4-oxalocrotonate tautomerase family)